MLRFIFSKQIPRVNVDTCSENEACTPTYQNNNSLLGMPRPALDIVQVIAQINFNL